MSIAFKYRTDPPTVLLTRDSTGESVTIDMADYLANEATYIAQHLDPPDEPEPDPLEELRQENTALREALIEKGVITKEEIDAKKPADAGGAEAAV